MGWKTVKEHYKIGHNVHMQDGELCIGSPYVSDLFRFDMEGKIILEPGHYRNEDWANPESTTETFPWLPQLKKDSESGKLKDLLAKKDEFGPTVQVFTSGETDIIEKECEEGKFGYPNCTTDGELMYNNTFFLAREEAEQDMNGDALSAIRNHIEQMARGVDEQKKRIRCMFESYTKMLNATRNIKDRFWILHQHGPDWLTEGIEIPERESTE